jgi:Chitobiase/beta-hexosaminidase C-terminal domain
VLLAVALSGLWLSSSAVASQTSRQAQKLNAAAAQVLTWTASNSITGYASAPTTATAGPATLVFETSAATGNTSGVSHTLTFDTSGGGYNNDVNVNIIASPFDAQGGHHEVQVNLTPGTYHYYCAMPGHQMSGELVVTAGGPTDTTPPQVSASVSGNQDSNGNYVGAATVTLSATDTESGVDTVEYALDSGAFTTYSGPLTVNTQGAHTVQYRATDKAGNTSQVASTSFTVVPPPAQDTTPPQVSATVSGTKNPDGTYDGQATVTVTATDTESGVASVEYAIDEQPFTAYSNPVVVNQPGSHSVQFRATDKAGNTSAAGSVSFTVAASQPKDTTPPTVSASVSGDQDSSGNYVGSATVTVAASDTESGVASVEYALDSGAFTAYSAPISVNAAGSHTVRYRATDKAGNTSQVGSVTFKVVAPSGGDTTPPQVSAQVTGNQDWAWNYVDSATVTISASDDNSGVASVEYALDGQPYTAYTKPYAVTQPGVHTVLIRATDKAGNTSDVSTAHFSVITGGSGSSCSEPGKSACTG